MPVGGTLSQTLSEVKTVRGLTPQEKIGFGLDIPWRAGAFARAA
jgi:hypothetical protein